jgi:hypothetical protein
MIALEAELGRLRLLGWEEVAQEYRRVDPLVRLVQWER